MYHISTGSDQRAPASLHGLSSPSISAPHRPPALALPALLLGAVGIGFAPIFVRWAAPETGPVAIAFWRMALSLPLLAAWWALDRRRASARDDLRVPRRAPTGAERARLVLAGACFAGDLAVWHWSLHYTSVTNATLLANLAPIFVALGAWLFLRERPTARFALALTIALAGTWTLLGSSTTGDVTSASARPDSAPGDALRGDLLGVAAAVFYAGYILSVADVRRRFSTPAVMTVGGAAASLVLLVAALAADEPFAPATLHGWLVLAGLALVSQVAGQSLITYALAHLPTGFSALTLLMQPVCAAVFAWWLLGEALGPQQALGGAIVLLGVLLARRATRSTPRQDQASSG
ncbi:MAG: DMT family transporter [Planctomycetota bacterium]